MEPTTKRKKEENGGKDANITKGKPCVSSTPGQLLERFAESVISFFPRTFKDCDTAKTN